MIILLSLSGPLSAILPRLPRLPRWLASTMCGPRCSSQADAVVSSIKTTVYARRAPLGPPEVHCADRNNDRSVTKHAHGKTVSWYRHGLDGVSPRTYPFVWQVYQSLERLRGSMSTASCYTHLPCDRTREAFSGTAIPDTPNVLPVRSQRMDNTAQTP